MGKKAVIWKILHETGGCNKLLNNQIDDGDTSIDCEPWEYDFKYEYVNEAAGEAGDLSNEKDAIKRFLRWNCDPIFKKGVDLDGCGKDSVCNLARDIYLKLWGWAADKETYGRAGIDFPLEFGPDTMNSFATSLKKYMEENTEFCNQDYWKEYKKKYPYNRVSELLIYTWWLEQEHKDKRLKELGVGVLKEAECLLNQYAHFTHTMGNFVLVPAYFNPYRYFKTHDAWDQSLDLLKNKQEDWIYKNRKVSHKIKWVKSDFPKYINFFFLWDYVIAESDKGSNCEVKTLWSDNDLLLGIEYCIWAIKRRGAFMTMMLKIYRLLDAKGVDELRNKVFVVSTIYKGYDEVLKEIERYVKEHFNEKISANVQEEIEALQKIFANIENEKAEVS